MSGPEYYTATESFSTDLDGAPVVVKRGENVRADHDLVKQNPDKFKPVELASRFDAVEQATAAPGEQRDTGRRGARAGGRGGKKQQ